MNYKDLFSKSWSRVWKHPVVYAFTLPVFLMQFISTAIPSSMMIPVCFIVFPVGIASMLIGSAGVMQVIYEIEQGRQPGILQIWNTIKKSLVDLVITNFVIIILALLLTIPVAILWFVFARSSLTNGMHFTWPNSLFPLLAFVIIYLVLVAFPTCQVLFRKSADLGDTINAGLKLTGKKIGSLLVIYLLLGVIQLGITIFSGSIAAIVHGIEPSQTSLLQAYALVNPTSTYRILSTLGSLAAYPLGITCKTLAYLEFTKEATEVVTTI